MTLAEAIDTLRKTYWPGGAGQVVADEVERLQKLFADADRCTVHGCRLYKSGAEKKCFSCEERDQAAAQAKSVEVLRQHHDLLWRDNAALKLSYAKAQGECNEWKQLAERFEKPKGLMGEALATALVDLKKARDAGAVWKDEADKWRSLAEIAEAAHLQQMAELGKRQLRIDQLEAQAEERKYGVNIGGRATLYGKAEDCTVFTEAINELHGYRAMIAPDAMQRIAAALERLVDKPEVRWVDADKKLNRIKELKQGWHHTDHSIEAGYCISCELGKVLDSHSPPVDKTDYGVACCDCGNPILGIHTVAGKIRCVECYIKSVEPK